MTFYKELILEHYQRPKHRGRISNPTHTVSRSNPLCGDEIEMDIVMKDDIVLDIKFRGKGCALSTASSSLLCVYAKGKSKDELKKMKKKDMMKLLGISLGPNRIKCALLPLEALRALLI